MYEFETTASGAKPHNYTVSIYNFMANIMFVVVEFDWGVGCGAVCRDLCGAVCGEMTKWVWCLV